jgi:peptidyl-prolyl cis-trans isomerase C
MANKVKASHILVEKHSKAEQIYNQLKSVSPNQLPNAFRKQAGLHSTCPSKKKGGNLGTFGRGAMVKEFEKAAFALEVGQMSGIVKTKFGYHIILRTG